MLASLVCGALAYTMPMARVSAPRHAAATMFFESQKGSEASEAAADFVVQSRKQHAKDLVSERKGCSLVVTEGSGNFYGARTLVQTLHDFGDHAKIVALSDSVATTKKALLTRNARYSGLLDTLEFAEGELVSAEAWLAINADEEALPAQLAAAAKAGVQRAFLLFTPDGPTACPSDAAAMEALLQESGLRYTVMRTGSLVDDGSSGGGLRLGEVDMAVCEDVSRDDVFRFVTEALTLSEAEGRTFSLCPSEETQGALRQMRLCGYERREEVQALLKGLVAAEVAAEELSAEEAEEAQELVLRSEAEIAAEREEELKALLSRARERGEKTQQKLKYEEEERARVREEMSKYYQAPPSNDDTIASLEESLKDGEPSAEGSDASDETPPPADDK